MVLLLWGGAFGVDLGFTVVGSRQAQAMADTAALDLARYIDIADWTTTITDGRASITFLDGKLANANTDNGSNATLTRDAGRVAERQLHPGWAEGRHSETAQCWFFKPFTGAIPATPSRSPRRRAVPQIFVGGHSHGEPIGRSPP